MRPALKILLIAGGVALAATAASAAFAQGPDQATPKGWNWETKDGKRVAKGERTVNPDGSSREEIRRGSCVTVVEKTADGTVKKSDRCD